MNINMSKAAAVLFLLLLFCTTKSMAINPEAFSLDLPRVMLSGIKTNVTIHLTQDFVLENAGEKIRINIIEMGTRNTLFHDSIQIDVNKPQKITIPDIIITHPGKRDILIELGEQSQTRTIRILPALLSILPPLLAILLALFTRQVIIALFFGIWLGVTFIFDYNPFLGFLHTLDEYIVNALAERNRISILIFSLVLGGMVGVISRSGGTQGIVDKLSGYAKNARMGQLATWGMGVLIFFDDYANTLIVGNTMRPLTDRLRISREKLSYLVDSTAAPVANIAIISTWIGYEISLINQSFAENHTV